MVMICELTWIGAIQMKLKNSRKVSKRLTSLLMRLTTCPAAVLSNTDLFSRKLCNKIFSKIISPSYWNLMVINMGF